MSTAIDKPRPLAEVSFRDVIVDIKIDLLIPCGGVNLSSFSDGSHHESSFGEQKTGHTLRHLQKVRNVVFLASLDENFNILNCPGTSKALSQTLST